MYETPMTKLWRPEEKIKVQRSIYIALIPIAIGIIY